MLKGDKNKPNVTISETGMAGPDSESSHLLRLPVPATPAHENQPVLSQDHGVFSR